MIIFVIGACIEALMGGESLLMIISAGILISFSSWNRKKGNLLIARVLLIIGVILLFISILTSFTFYLITGTIITYYAYHHYKSSKNPEKITVKLIEPTIEIIDKEENNFIKIEPFFKNILAGEMRSTNDVYELDDINIQCGFGDIHIDLSHAIVPTGETVILIRGVLGNIRLYIPYDIDLSIQTSILLGKIDVFEENKTTFNITQKYQTKNYQTSTRKIKIITSLLIGEIEVKNI